MALLLVTCEIAGAQSQPQQYYGEVGGELTGYVLGMNGQPLDWAIIYARSSQRTFEAFSGISGVYQMRVPVGKYNVTAAFPSYMPLSTNVTVTNGSSNRVDFRLNSITVYVSGGSSSVINFYLDQNQVPVPEFQSTIALFLMVTLASTLLLRRHTSPKERA